jgi:glutamate dehydrogenase/leucine dehydrogenase
MSRHIDAALTSGTSPGARSARIHILGPGAVGRALLRRIAGSRHTLVAVTDSTGTVADAKGLDANAIAGWKKAGRSLSNHPASTGRTWVDAADRTAPDVVIDTTSSIPRNG